MSQFTIHLVQASSVRNGDYLVMNANEDLVDGFTLDHLDPENHKLVATVKVGRKNTLMLDKSEKKLGYITNEDPVAVVREEETAEEQQERTDIHLRESLQKDLARGLSDYEPHKLLQDATVDYQGMPRTPHGLINRALDDLIAGQAKYDFFAEVEHLYNADLGARPTTGDIVQSFVVILAARLSPSSGGGVNPLSRSTSLTANLIDDMKRWAAEDFLSRSMAGWMIRPLVLEAISALR